MDYFSKKRDDTNVGHDTSPSRYEKDLDHAQEGGGGVYLSPSFVPGRIAAFLVFLVSPGGNKRMASFLVIQMYKRT